MIDLQSLDLSSLPWLPLDARSAFPRQPAIYFAIDSQNVIQYVGRSVDPKNRWGKHHRYEQLQAIGGVRIAYLFVDAPDLLVEIETALIAWFDPPLNVAGRLESNEGLDYKTGNFASGRIKWRLAVLMADRELDYKQLAEKADMHPVTISKLKNSREMPPRLDRVTLEKLCKALDCQPGDLLRYIPDESE